MHTHLFPDDIAEKAVRKLAVGASLSGIYPHTEGTAGSILRSMDDAGVSLSVVMPVATGVSQFDSINRFAKHLNDTYQNILSFGGIHPKDERLREHLETIKSLDLNGIKIHPDYQDIYFDDRRIFDLLCICYELNLAVVTHSGEDPQFDKIHCDPKTAATVLKSVEKKYGFKEPFVVFAHMGGSGMCDDVEKHLAGTNCYFDLSHGFEFCNKDQLLRIIKKHGVNRILFATDSPWRDQKDYVEKLKKLEGLSDNEKNMIFSQNAVRLLKIGPKNII